MSEDPIGFASGDHNKYRYVSNGPIQFVDADGLQELKSGQSFLAKLQGTSFINRAENNPNPIRFQSYSTAHGEMDKYNTYPPKNTYRVLTLDDFQAVSIDSQKMGTLNGTIFVGYDHDPFKIEFSDMKPGTPVARMLAMQEKKKQALTILGISPDVMKNICNSLHTTPPEGSGLITGKISKEMISSYKAYYGTGSFININSPLAYAQVRMHEQGHLDIEHIFAQLVQREAATVSSSRWYDGDKITKLQAEAEVRKNLITIANNISITANKTKQIVNNSFWDTHAEARDTDLQEHAKRLRDTISLADKVKDSSFFPSEEHAHWKLVARVWRNALKKSRTPEIPFGTEKSKVLD